MKSPVLEGSVPSRARTGLVGLVVALALAAIAGGAAGCGGTPRGESRPPGEAKLEDVPAEYAAEVGRAWTLGEAIWRTDTASAVASDALQAKVGGRDPRVRGWVTAPREAGWMVRFLDDHGRALHDVAVDASGRAGAVASLQEPVPLGPPTEAAMARAVETAATSPEFKRSSAIYNPVVLPGSLIGKQGWLVYLLAATTDPHLAVFGIHYRAVVSPDGGSLESFEPLSRSAVVIGKDAQAPRGGRVAALMVSHLLSPTFSEVHVLVSLQHRLPVFVLTTQNQLIWKIDPQAKRSGISRSRT